LDTESFGELLLLGGINFTEGEWWVILSKDFSSSAVFWCKLFAVTAPWSIEFNEEEVVVLELIIEVFISEYEDSIFLLDFVSEN
jgi:hypothetical protein